MGKGNEENLLCHTGGERNPQISIISVESIILGNSFLTILFQFIIL